MKDASRRQHRLLCLTGSFIASTPSSSLFALRRHAKGDHRLLKSEFFFFIALKSYLPGMEELAFLFLHIQRLGLGLLLFYSIEGGREVLRLGHGILEIAGVCSFLRVRFQPSGIVTSTGLVVSNLIPHPSSRTDFAPSG